MSESIKTFWFDLQRFAVTLYLADQESGSKKYVHANGEIPTEDPTDEETGKATKGQYFWESTDVIEAGENTKITFSTATKESATYTVESGESTKEKSFNYYTVSKDDATKLENLVGVTALNEIGAISLEFGYAAETGGKKDAVALSDGEMTAVTLATANTTLLVAGAGAEGEDFSINGSAVNVEGAEGYTYIFVKSGGNNSLDVSNGEPGSVTVSKAGDAKILYVPAATEVGEIQIGSDTFSYIGGGGEAGEAGYFKLNGSSKVNGFVFFGGDALTLPADSSISLYYGAKEKEVPSALSISGVDEYAISAVGESGDVTSFAVEVADGANVKLGSTTFDFAIEGEHEEAGVSIGFSTKGSLEGVYGLVAGDAVTVAGGSSKGVKFFASEAGAESGLEIKVASGNFVYGIDEDTEVGTLTLTQNADSVLGLDGAEAGIKVVPAEGTTTVTILKDTFSFVNNSGEAYFMTDETGTVTASFYFGDEGDALTFTKATKSDEFGLLYNLGDEAGTLSAAPTVSGYPYTIELTELGDDEASTTFQIADIADKSKVEFADEAGVFTFGGEGGSIKFNGGGSPSGFIAAEGGTVTLDTAAAALLVPADEDNPFTINEVAINIDGEAGTKGLVYDDNDKSLNGFAEGDITVLDAGVVKKIFTPKGEAGFTFGEDDDAQEFTVASKKGTSFLTVDGAKATGFTFVEVEDAITGDFSDFQLYDGEDDTTGFAAPKVTDDEGEAITAATITKVKTGFQIAAEEGYNIEFADGTKLTFSAVSGDEAAVVFDKTGALVSVTGLTEADDTMIVEGATGEVSVDGAAYEITGASWTYQMNEDTEVTIRDLKSGVKVLNSGEAVELWSAGGENGTFQFGSASAYTVSGADNDTVEGEAGIQFKWDGKAVIGLGSLDDNTSVAGAMNGLTFNDNEEALAITDGIYTVFGGGQSLAGLKAGTEITAQGGVSDFITIEEGKFTFGSEYEIKGDKEVTFTLANLELQAINGLGGSAIGDFTGGLSVNKQAVEVTGDATIAVVGNEETVTEIHQLGGTVDVVSAGDTSLVGANEDGSFIFTFAGGTSFALSGNKEIETTFTIAEGAVTAIDGLDEGEIVAGGFSKAIKVEGSEIQVANDDMISLVGGASKAITGLSDGAEVISAGGAKFAVTDEEGSFVIGGKSFAIKGDKEVTFVLDADGNVTGINGLDDAATVTGDLNNITVNEGDPFDIRDNTNYSYSPNTGVSGVVDTNTVKSADGAKNVWVGGGASFTVTFENGAFAVAGETDGVNFLVKDTNIAIAVESLDAGATISGDFSQITSVNGASFAISDGDNSVSLVGADDGIGQILGLTAEAKVTDAGGASLAKTDKAGAFTFGDISFTTADDDEVAFGLNDKGEVETISELSGAVTGSFSGITGINEKEFDVKDADGVLTVYGNESEDDISKISGVTGDAEIGEVGSVSQILTDEEGKFNFTVGGQSFTTGDGAKEVTFGLSASKVVSIDKLNGSVLGSFSGIAVNGAEIDITDGDNILKVLGDGTKLTAIEEVDADATINKAGGVAALVGNIAASSGSFTFAGNSGAFEVAGDDKVTFVLDQNADATAIGIAGLKGNVTGNFAGISSINGKTFEVEDADGILTVYGNAGENDITKIEGVTAEATIGEIGSVSQVITDSEGKFTFKNGSWSIAGDNEVTFGMSSSNVIAISELVGTVTGAFEDVTVNGQNFQISGDSSIALVGGASGVTAIEKLSGGADIVRAEGYLTATTDSEGTFTFANGRTIQVLGDSSVVFGLNNGLVMSIDDLDETATIIGAINNIAINGSSSMFDVRNNANLWYSNGTLSAVVDGNTIVSADGATTVQVATDGTYTFGNGAFEISGDADGVAQFTVSDSSIATAINGVDAGATITGDLNGMAINGGASLVVENDDSFGAVAGDGVLAKLINLSDGANVVEAGGASQFVTDAEGSYTILGTAMEIDSDNSVTFTASEDGITAIDDLQGTAIGDFREEIAVNDNPVQVLNDSVVAVTADDDAVTNVDSVSGGATVVAVGGATEVGTDTEGNFTFTTGSDSQAFTVEGDSEVTFNLDDSGNVVGVTEFDEDGVLSFNAEIEELAVNDAELTFETTTNASLSVVGGEVNYVKGVTDAIDGLENATVEATQAMTVNGTDVDVEGDDDYKIVVVDGEVVGLEDISGDATVNVEAAVSIAVDQGGEFEIGGDKYSFTDEDNSFTLTTDEEGKLAAVGALEGEMVIDQPATKELTVNGGELSFASAADSVTVGADATGITSIDGLINNDAVYGDLGGASIAMPGSTASVRGEGSFLTVNDVTYELLNDEDGITVTGGRVVTDLAEEASLYTSAKGMYTVNGNGSDIDVEDTNLPIIGLDDATDAYIYDPSNLIIRKGTQVSAIEQMLGLPTEYPYQAGSEEAPLDNAGLSALREADLDRPLEVFMSNDEKGVQELDLSETDFSKKVHLYDGDQAVSFNNAGGNLAVVERENADGTETGGRKAIELGDNGDAVIMKADAGNGSEVGIVGGAGDDSVVIQGSAPTTFDMSEGGDDLLLMFASSNARVSLAGYNALTNQGAGIRITERWTKDLASAIVNGLLDFGNGRMSIGNDPSANAQVDFGSNFNNFVNLFNYLGQKQAVGFSPDNGGLVDGSGSADPLILLGNNKDNKSGNSTLLGGTGDDTAIAGGGDYIDLGAGNNVVNLRQDPYRSGAEVNLAQGRTTITGFISSFNAQHGDRVDVDLAAADISFDGENVIIAGDNFYGVLADIPVDGEISYDTATDLAESADLVESADEISTSLKTSEGDYANVLFNNNGVDVKTAIAKEEGVIDVKLDFDARALNYVGENSGLTFYDHTGEVLVNLGEGTGSIDTDAALFSGINKVAAGDGQTTLIGAEANETLIAGTGNDSIWAAGGKNLLVGHSETEKTGQTSFFVVAEADGAANTIQSFNFVDDDSWNTNTNKITADVLDIQVQYDRIDIENGGVDISGDDVVLFVTNRNENKSESVVIEGARGQDFVVSGDGYINDVIAQVNTDSLVANKFANLFVATGKNATLTVSDDIDTANIYLGGRPVGTDYEGDVPEFYGDIHVIDASGSNALVELGGNAYDNTLIAGSGDASLWGGDGGNDLLVGGTGQDTFFYNLGNGDDTVQGAKKGDIVDLSTIQIDDIVGEIGDGGVVLNFSDGGSLTVDSTDVEFKVSGATYVVENGEWKTK